MDWRMDGWVNLSQNKYRETLIAARGWRATWIRTVQFWSDFENVHNEMFETK